MAVDNTQQGAGYIQGLRDLRAQFQANAQRDAANDSRLASVNANQLRSLALMTKSLSNIEKSMSVMLRLQSKLYLLM